MERSNQSSLGRPQGEHQTNPAPTDDTIDSTKPAGSSQQATAQAGRISADATLADIIAWAAKQKQARMQNSGSHSSLPSDRVSTEHSGQSLSGSGLSSIHTAGATGAHTSDALSHATPAQKSRESLSTFATRLLSQAHRSAVPQQSNPRMETKMLSVYKMANFWGYATAPHAEPEGHSSRASSPRAGTVEGDSDSEYTRPTPTCERGAATMEPRLCRTFEESIGSALSVRTLARRVPPASPPRAENAVCLSRMLAELESADLTIPETTTGPDPAERLDSRNNGSFGSAQGMIQEPSQMLTRSSQFGQPPMSHPWHPRHATAATPLHNAFQQFQQGFGRGELIRRQLQATPANPAAMPHFGSHSFAAQATAPSQSQPNPVVESMDPRTAFQAPLHRSGAVFPSDAPATSGWQWALAPQASAASTAQSKSEEKPAEVAQDTLVASASAEHYSIGPTLAPRTTTISPSANDSKKQAARARRPPSSAAPAPKRRVAIERAACTLCRRTKKACADERPCPRCVRKGPKEAEVCKQESDQSAPLEQQFVEKYREQLLAHRARMQAAKRKEETS